MSRNRSCSILDEEEQATLVRDAHAQSDGRPLVVVVGPEGGLDRPAPPQRWWSFGAQRRLALGPSCCAPKAAPAALAVLRHLDGDLG